jgi:hypothetical protein
MSKRQCPWASWEVCYRCLKEHWLIKAAKATVKKRALQDITNQTPLAKGNKALLTGKPVQGTLLKKDPIASIKKANVLAPKTTVKKSSTLVPKSDKTKKSTEKKPTQRRKSSSVKRSAKVKVAPQLESLPEVVVTAEEEIPEPEYMPPSVNLKGELVSLSTKEQQLIVCRLIDLEYDRDDKIDFKALTRPLPFLHPHEIKAWKELQEEIFVPEEMPELHWGELFLSYKTFLTFLFCRPSSL